MFLCLFLDLAISGTKVRFLSRHGVDTSSLYALPVITHIAASVLTCVVIS